MFWNFFELVDEKYTLPLTCRTWFDYESRLVSKSFDQSIDVLFSLFAFSWTTECSRHELVLKPKVHDSCKCVFVTAISHTRYFRYGRVRALHELLSQGALVCRWYLLHSPYDVWLTAPWLLPMFSLHYSLKSVCHMTSINYIDSHLLNWWEFGRSFLFFFRFLLLLFRL